MKKSIILLIILSTALIRCQCEPDIKDNERSLVRGTVTDSNDNPIKDISVNLKVREIDLGQGLTDQSGAFEFMSLVSSFNNYSLNINPIDPESEFSDYKINFIQRIFSGTIDLGTIPLSKKATLKLSIRNTSSNPLSVNYNIEYRISECTISGDETVTIDYSNCFDTNFYSDRISPGTPNIDVEFASLLGSTAILNYTIENGEAQTEIISLDQRLTTYELEY